MIMLQTDAPTLAPTLGQTTADSGLPAPKDGYCWVLTSELLDAGLNWAVAMSEGLNVYAASFGPLFKSRKFYWGVAWMGQGSFEPCTNWAQGGPISTKAEIWSRRVHIDKGIGIPREIVWEATGLSNDGSEHTQQGDTELFAKMRCRVAMKLGAQVQIPKVFCE